MLKQQKKNGTETELLDIDSCRCLYLLETELYCTVYSSHLHQQQPKKEKEKKGIIKRMNKPLGFEKSVSLYT